MNCIINIAKNRIYGINQYNYDLAMSQLYLVIYIPILSLNLSSVNKG